MNEAEPRRSVRSTKGQHNQRAVDPLDQPLETKQRRGGKKSSKRQADPEPEPEPEEEEEEVIRCVCGATSQDTDDPEDPWIACDRCHVWQHNVCVGMSVFDEDLEEIEYYCEECKPEAHKELLDGNAKGKKVWEKRRQVFVAEKAAEKQKKKVPPKKGKSRKSEIPDDARASHAKSSASPAPVPEKKSKTMAAKRKELHDSADPAIKEPSKLRKMSEGQAQSVPHYEPPADIPEAITELANQRQGPAKLLEKSMLFAVEKIGHSPADGVSNEGRALRLTLLVERAVHDSRQHDYTKQIRSLAANLKSNLDLIARLLDNTLTPPMLAAMSSEELQTKKMQQETAAAKERSVRQSVISMDESQGPRIRKTHKGDEIVDDGSEMTNMPQRQLPKAGGSSNAQQTHSRNPSGDRMRIDSQQSSESNFDINTVYNNVPKSPSAAYRRPSNPAPPAPWQGQLVNDPDMDRLLQDDDPDSEYSPEESDPDVVWRGQLTMTATADFAVNAKHVAGANLVNTLNLPWSTLLPRKLTVGGRIAMQSATEYLCSLRWSSTMDLIVASLEAAHPEGKADFDAMYNYFTTRERWAVVGDKGIANVKDTYLIPVAAGQGNHPEFLLNLEDNFLPQTRDQNTLLLVIVYRNDEATMQQLQHLRDSGGHGSAPTAPPSGPLMNPSPSPAPNNGAPRSNSAIGPGYSPTTPHVGAGGFAAPQGVYNAPAQYDGPSAMPVSADDAQRQAQRQGEAMARSILGPCASAPTLVYLMPHAHMMSSTEWQIIRRVLEQDERARTDLTYLGQLISKESETPDTRRQPTPSNPNHAQGPPLQAMQSLAVQPRQQQPQHQQAYAQPQNGMASPGQLATPGVAPLQQAPRQTPISLPSVAGMPASVHQSYHQAQADAQARNVQSPAPPPSSAAPPA